jgi:predicted kinase
MLRSLLSYILMTYLLITHGPTHTGKTTFGAKLRAEMTDSAKFIHVDNDTVDEFIKANFNNLRTDPEVLARRTPSDPDLRLLIPQQIAGYALREGYSVIATAAHPKRVIRQKYYDIAAENGAKPILLIFKVTEQEVMRRIEANRRSKDILDISPHGGTNFPELYERQKAVIEPPTDEEKERLYKVYEITDDNADDALKELVALLE